MKQRPLNIALVHAANARDVRPASGSLYFSRIAFERWIGTVTDLTPAPHNTILYRAATKLIHMTTGKWYSYYHDRSLARRYGQHFSALLAKGDYDLVFSPFGSSVLAYLETEVPIIYFSDATWRTVHNYYGYYSNVIKRTARDGDEIERRALERSSLVLMSSQWAADSAIHDYGIDPRNVRNVFIGANLIDPPARDAVLPRYLGERLRLLLVGVSWEIKGGEVAYDTLLRLLEMGFDAELTVLGCQAPSGVEHPRLHVVPFLNKQIPAEREEFERIWREADFFILPTRFDATPVVLCEASANAIPAFVRNTGGIASVVSDGRNGYLLPSDAGGEMFAERIASVARDRNGYAALCESSRQEFESRLNWDSWGRRVAKVIGEHFPHLRERLP